MNASAAVALVESRTMQAMVQRRYGPPEVLAAAAVPVPVPGADEVLVRVRAAGVSIGDHHIVTGKPYLVRVSPFGGLPGPKQPIPGSALAGVVEAVGANVTGLRVGDEVFGSTQKGAFADYVALPASLLVRKPSSLSFEAAAAVPWGMTALQGLRDAGRLQAGQRVVVVGGSGAVGTWAIQVAKALCAHVTAVCSTRNVEQARALGADDVIDYTKDDFTRREGQFDVVFDVVGNRSFSDLRRVMSPTATYVPCAGEGGDWFGPFGRVIVGLLSFLFSRQRFAMFVMEPNQRDLCVMRDLVESGRAKPVVERVATFPELPEALRQVGEGHSRGQTVVRISR